jgi:phage FluMu protein Com
MREIRCKRCKRLLFKLKHIKEAEIQAKCPRCKYINKFQFQIYEDELYYHPLDE